MGRRGMAVVGVVLGLLMSAGCGPGDDEGGGLPTLGSDSSGPTSASTTMGETSATPTEGSSSGGPPNTIAVHRRKVVAASTSDKAAADAFIKYIEVRLTAYHKVQVDLDALGETATGAALNAVRSDVAGLRSRGQHTVGEVWVDVPKVTARGSAATLTSCMVNTTVDVDAKGKPLSAPKPFYNITSTLELGGGKIWLVKTITFGGDRPCH
ncbi:hypothetical protein [Kribbella sp. NBC_00889]|uniref:hypothetical protein n=1 Tax=Kribbella sp. NBC_00889 TaxID=2975974 RepID=UPI00386793F1|nr:hypothetical protein OG817_30420 [Kribbella sp. NBC_00889]